MYILIEYTNEKYNTIFAIIYSYYCLHKYRVNWAYFVVLFVKTFFVYIYNCERNENHTLYR